MSKKNCKMKEAKNEVQALDESMLNDVSGGAVSIDANVDGEKKQVEINWSADTSEEFVDLTRGMFKL